MSSKGLNTAALKGGKSVSIRGDRSWCAEVGAEPQGALTGLQAATTQVRGYDELIARHCKCYYGEGKHWLSRLTRNLSRHNAEAGHKAIHQKKE